MKRLMLAALAAAALTACGDELNDPGPPISENVNYAIASRVEVDDSIMVAAADAEGLVRVGWQAHRKDGTLFGGDSAEAGGASYTRAWALDFEAEFHDFPVTIEVTAFAVNTRGERMETGVPSAPTTRISSNALLSMQPMLSMAPDTIIVVSGVTRPLPDGGTIADAIYNPNLNEVYLTNIDLNRLEIFQLADTSFVAGGIPTGSDPWGIALWPHDIFGAHADTVIVANSGGTNLSIVDVSTAVRREVRRHHLPNFLVQSVQTEIDEATGFIKLKIVEFDFSDRPEYIGMTCIMNGNNCFADSIYAVYSTLPTEAQAGDPVDFVMRGTMRWENLTGPTPESHFWWEQAAVAPSPDADTLQIWVDRGPGTTTELILSASCGRMVNMAELAFLDSTFVRNSGDFTHALVGEGGGRDGQIEAPNAGFARVIGYSRTTGHVTNTCPDLIIQGVLFSGNEVVDLGISPAIRVRDFIVNTAISVKSIALNFNGLTNLVRADSIYVLDEGLRLMGIVNAGGAVPGMDLNFDHAFDARDAGTPTFGGSGDPDDRLLFAGTDDPLVSVYDTYFYDIVAAVPIRDPIIGPMRVAKTAGGEQIIVGVTGQGIVVVTIPPIANIFPAPGG
jgi:hypothetical protein